MSFFKDCENVTIRGGDFNDVDGDLVVHHHRNRRGSDEEMPRSPGYRGYHTGPPSPQSPHWQQQQHPRFSPPQAPSTGGTATNPDSFNVERPHTNGVFNEYPQNYYQGGAPLDNRRQHNEPNWMSGPDQGTIPSTSGSHGRGQFRASVQVPSQAGYYSGGNYDPRAAYSSPRNVERSNFMNTGNLSLNDPQPQIPTHLSPHTPFSSDSQIDLNLTVQMRSSNSSTSNLNPPGPDNVDETDEQIPTAAESTADSSGKGKKAKKWFKRN